MSAAAIDCNVDSVLDLDLDAGKRKLSLSSGYRSSKKSSILNRRALQDLDPGLQVNAASFGAERSGVSVAFILHYADAA